MHNGRFSMNSARPGRQRFVRQLATGIIGAPALGSLLAARKMFGEGLSQLALSDYTSST